MNAAREPKLKIGDVVSGRSVYANYTGRPGKIVDSEWWTSTYVVMVEWPDGRTERFREDDLTRVEV